MNARVKRKWVKALRSGQYKQGRADLINEDGHCCLGVLVEEMAPQFVAHPGDPYPYRGYADPLASGAVISRGDPVFGTIPDDLAILWGLDDATQDELATMNDRHGSSFDGIADWIEENL